MPRSEIYIGSLAYSKELLLIELELLNKLQRLSLREGTSVSETINNLLNKQLKDKNNE